MLAWRKGDRQLECAVVQGKTNKLNSRTIGNWKLAKARDSKGAGKLSRPIGAEVKEEHSITVLDRSYRLTVVAHKRNWVNKLIRNPALIRLPDRRDRILTTFANRVNKKI